MASLTSFQIKCEEELISLLKRKGLALMDRETHGTAETYIQARVSSGDIQVWIYDTEAMLEAGGRKYFFEVPDYPGESARIEAFVSAVSACVEGRIPADPGSSRLTLFNDGKI